jgi:lysozyme
LKTSNLGRNFIKQFENLRLKAYRDTPGIWTIGWGHTKGVKEGDVIDELTAEIYFDQDLQPPEGVLNAESPLLLQTEFDALCSFAFNVGISAFRKSTLFKCVYIGDSLTASKEFLKWNKTRDKDGKLIVLPGLTRRRKAESELFFNGIY